MVLSKADRGFGDRQLSSLQAALSKEVWTEVRGKLGAALVSDAALPFLF